MKTNDTTAWEQALAGEIWKPIPGIEECCGSFEASSEGRVRNARTGRIHKQSDNGQGYLRIRIKRRFYKVHRLVAAAFLPNPENLATVNHNMLIRLTPKTENTH